jgi:alkylation response protein AidB-like acyl-CoA dehydrogenase
MGMLSLGFLEEGQFMSSMEAQASKNGTGYRLQGKKDFIPLAGLADHLIVACRTGPKDAGKMSLFLLNRASDPVDTRPSGAQLGMRMISMEELGLDNVTAPADRLIGEEHEGYGPLLGFLQEMAVEAGAMGVGMAQGAFDRALDYSGKREQFGKRIIHFDAIGSKLAEMRMQVETARLAVYRAAWLLDQGKADAVTLWMAKILGAGAACRVASDAVQIHGGLGYMKEMHVERFYRDARALDLFLLPGKGLKGRIADHIAGREGQKS